MAPMRDPTAPISTLARAGGYGGAVMLLTPVERNRRARPEGKACLRQMPKRG